MYKLGKTDKMLYRIKKTRCDNHEVKYVSKFFFLEILHPTKKLVNVVTDDKHNFFMNFVSHAKNVRSKLGKVDGYQTSA